LGGTRKDEIGDRMVKRLSLYLRLLHEMRERGELYASGTAVAGTLGLDPIVVRKDLARSGVRGTPRLGFSVTALIAAIEQFLGWNAESHAVLAGVGRLGSALLGYAGFHQNGLRIVAAFDNNPRRVGHKMTGVPVHATGEITDVVRKLSVGLGILTVPPEAAQSVTDAMVAGGIRGIWNFTAVQLVVPAGVTVKREDLAASLAVLSHRLRAKTRVK
jgi:redox-sensing transcriptional repressor